MKRLLAVFSILVFVLNANAQEIPEGYTSLFNGKDFSEWIVPIGDNGHWKIVDGVIDYDAESEAKGNKNLMSGKIYKDFELYVDWRIKETPWVNENVPFILPSGLHKLDENGKEIKIKVPDSDSGILYRMPGGTQANIWCWPIGSGEVYSYRMNKDYPLEVRKGVTPKINADNNIGEWNTFKITVRGEYLTVILNGQLVIDGAHLPGLPAEGRIGLQHHGSKREGKWVSPPSLVQFKNIYIREL